MMDYAVKDSIEGTKELIRKQVDLGSISVFGKAFSEYQKVYSITNENVGSYLEKIKPRNKDKALSVLGSGDQAFNLVFNGFNKIDTFDSNRLTEYFALGFKKCLINEYNYEDFLNIMNSLVEDKLTLDEECDLINSLLPHMEKKYRDYWYKVSEYNYKLQKKNNKYLSLFKMLAMDMFNSLNKYSEKIVKYNAYLKDAESYNKLKGSISNAEINFKYANAFKLYEEFKDKYDAILLSNILDYFESYFGNLWPYDKLEDYEIKLKPLLNNDGILFLFYKFLFCDKNSISTERKVFQDSDIGIKDLKGEEIIKIDRINSNVYDSLVYVRKKNIIDSTR